MNSGFQPIHTTFHVGFSCFRLRTEIIVRMIIFFEYDIDLQSMR